MTPFDVVAGLILMVSAFVGFSRGVVMELVSLFAFTFASLASVFLLPLTAPTARDLVHPSWAANAMAVLVVFLVAYIALRILGSTMRDLLHRQSTLGMVDRTVGLGFGLVRALVLLGVVYLVFNAAPSVLVPRWISASALYPLAKASADGLEAIAPAGLRTMGGFGHVLKARASEGVSPDGDTNVTVPDDSGPLTSPKPADPDPYAAPHRRRHRHRTLRIDPADQVE